MEPNQQKKTSKQNITRDIEIKNKLTATRGEGDGDNGGKKGDGLSETCIKDTWTKPRGWDQGWEVGLAGVEGRVGGGMATTVLEQQ